MNYFALLKSGLDLTQMRSEISGYDRWEDLSLKRDMVPTHKDTFRIQLRTAKTVPGLTYHNIHETKDMPAWRELLHTRSFVVDFLNEVGGEVGHVRLAKMPGRGKIKPHIDEGSYFAARNRYHLVVQAAAGTRFHSANETVVMRENELWWFDNKQLHSVENLSDTPRVHLVFDILPPNASPIKGEEHLTRLDAFPQASDACSRQSGIISESCAPSPEPSGQPGDGSV